MARTTRKKGAAIGNRSLVALGLIGLLGVAALVVWRRTLAVAENREVRALEEKKRDLVSMRTTLERDLVEATSRQKIVPAAEKRLGMHVATELEVRNLPSRASRENAIRENALRDSALRDTASADTLSLHPLVRE